jgi:hypothetical protein
MTTTFENQTNTETIAALAEGDPTESVAIYETDPSTYTIAEAWMSSALGEPDEDIRYDFAAAQSDDRQGSTAGRAKLFAVLASGIIGGATLGAVLFGSIEPANPTFIVPNSGVSTSPLPASSTPPSTPPSAPPKPAAVAPAPKPAVAQEQAPKPVAPTPDAVPPAPNSAVDPGIPPVSAPPVVVDISIPPLPPLPDKPAPQPPAPEPPAPEPPKFNPPNIDVVQVPQLDPDPPRTQLNPVVKPKPGRIESVFPDNDEPQRTQLNTGTGSRFNVQINKP